MAEVMSGLTGSDLAWARQRSALQRQAEDEHQSRFWALKDRAERRLRDVRAARKTEAQKVAPPPADAGRGWRVLPHPRASHESLERHARAIWAFVWHGIDWPDGWRVRWGALDAALLLGAARGHCALFERRRVLGLCVPAERIVLLDEGNHRGRTPREFDTTIIHELVHVNVRNEVHGPAFRAALDSASAYYFAGTCNTGASTPVRPAPDARPAPPTGVRFRPGGFDPTLEYRG